MSETDQQNSDDVRNELNPDPVDILLEHVARYRLSIFAAMQQLRGISAEGPRTLRRLLKHCRDSGLMGSAILHSGLRYWFLTRDGAVRCGIDPSRSGPLSEAAKLRACALLHFCCLSETRRHRLSGQELNRGCTQAFRCGLPGTYYFSPSGNGVIGLARIDAGHSGRWDRVVHTVRNDIQTHGAMSGFRELIATGRFEITVLTVLPCKAERIDGAIRLIPDHTQFPVHVVAQPELLPLIVSRQGRR
jgi:hypothetical protein